MKILLFHCGFENLFNLFAFCDRDNDNKIYSAQNMLNTSLSLSVIHFSLSLSHTHTHTHTQISHSLVLTSILKLFGFRENTCPRLSQECVCVCVCVYKHNLKKYLEGLLKWQTWCLLQEFSSKCKYCHFLFYQILQIKFENEDFDQCLEWAPPQCWLKYTTNVFIWKTLFGVFVTV